MIRKLALVTLLAASLNLSLYSVLPVYPGSYYIEDAASFKTLLPFGESPLSNQSSFSFVFQDFQVFKPSRTWQPLKDIGKYRFSYKTGKAAFNNHPFIFALCILRI